MTTVYDDSRLTYDHPNATYEGVWLIAATGDQPAPTGALTRRLLAVRASQASTQPPATSTLIWRIPAQLRSLAGQQASGVGALSYHIRRLHALEGAQAPASGTLTRVHWKFRWNLGTQSAPLGTLTRRASLHATPLGSTQVFPSGTLRQGYRYRRTLTGTQPVLVTVSYEEPDITYNQAGQSYEITGPGVLIRRWHALRVLTGLQPESSGAFLWRWRDYTWAQYQTYVRETPGGVAYVTPVETDDSDVRYDATVHVEQADGGVEIVYRVRAPRVGVHERRQG